MILERIPDLSRLTPAEKLQLVSELWDDLAAHPSEVLFRVSRSRNLTAEWRNTSRIPAR
jgi:hypothetical protein